MKIRNYSRKVTIFEKYSGDNWFNSCIWFKTLYQIVFIVIQIVEGVGVASGIPTLSKDVWTLMVVMEYLNVG